MLFEEQSLMWLSEEYIRNVGWNTLPIEQHRARAWREGPGRIKVELEVMKEK